MVTVAQLHSVLDEVDDDVEVLVELPGTFRPVAGVSIRSTAERARSLIVLADL